MGEWEKEGGQQPPAPPPQVVVHSSATLQRVKQAVARAKIRNRVYRVLVVGTGFLADSYDLFVINVSLLMMKEVDYLVPLTPSRQAHISIMAVLGAMVGQLAFGIMGDRFGRKSIFVYCAALTVLGNLMQSLVQPSARFSIWSQLMLARFVMGLGVGGEYPMSATITAEVSEPANRGTNLALVFMMQGVGRILCSLVLVAAAHLIQDPNLQWRVAMGFGALPMLAAAFFRWLPETEAYRTQVERRIPPSKRLAVMAHTVKEHWRTLLGTAGSWFLIDILFYGNSFFTADVTRAMDVENTIQDKALQNLYIQLMAFPGYLCAVAFLQRMGRKNMQMFGFLGEAMTFALMAIFQSQLRQSAPGAFVVLYGLTFFFDDCGPNTTTYVIPAEVFPTEARSSCHGISAAFGKAGAALGGVLFFHLEASMCPKHRGPGVLAQCPKQDLDKGLRLVFWVCSGVALVGLLWTWGLVDDTPHPSIQAPRDEPQAVCSAEGGQLYQLGAITAGADSKLQEIAEGDEEEEEEEEEEVPDRLRQLGGRSQRV